MWKPTEGDSGPGLGKAVPPHSPKAIYTIAESFHGLTRSMKRKIEAQLVTVEDFHRRCLQGTKPRLGPVSSQRGPRVRRKRRVACGSPQATLWNRLRDG